MEWQTKCHNKHFRMLGSKLIVAAAACAITTTTIAAATVTGWSQAGTTAAPVATAWSAGMALNENFCV